MNINKTADNAVSYPRLFWAMACDLHLEGHPNVQKAYSLLNTSKFLSFIKEVDSWTTQLYTSSLEHQRWNQLACFLIKYPFTDPSLDRDAAAMTKFYRSEHRCRRMNTLIRAVKSKPDHPLAKQLAHMRRYIRSVIGVKPDMRQIYSECGFGPGSSIGVSGNATHLGAKLSAEVITCSPLAFPYACAAVLHHRSYLNTLFEGPYCLDAEWLATSVGERVQYVHYNKITCVPKNAKTSRTIAVEPLWNGFVQKGIDAYLRRKLMRVGINLNDQSHNQALAKLGSKDSSYATIDISAASDSVSIELVRAVMPEEWFKLLNATRSWEYKTSEGTATYEKFCSMGNGFCFPLETLIFASIVDYCYSQTGHHYRVIYGDDIVVATGSALLVMQCLAAVGFKPNFDKTFVHGPFRESCGADFYLGENVRPVYHHSEIEHPTDWYPLANALYRKGYMRTRDEILKGIPKRWQLYRPYQRDDDSALEAPLDVFMTSGTARWDRHCHTWTWKKIARAACSDPRIASDALLMAGYLHGSLGSHGAVTLSKERRRSYVPESTQKFSLRNQTRTRVVTEK